MLFNSCNILYFPHKYFNINLVSLGIDQSYKFEWLDRSSVIKWLALSNQLPQGFPSMMISENSTTLS